ncbi:MAG: ferredoxin [Firmicutes bacterium]|nr:ferredoxin [Bacillota bacterium]
MRVKVDQDLCIGCGLCIDTCPAVFTWNEAEKATASQDPVPPEEEDPCREAMEGCPTQAITEA